jgi:hypothetical protein
MPPLSEVAGLRAGVVPPTSKLLPAPLVLALLCLYYIQDFSTVLHAHETSF